MSAVTTVLRRRGDLLIAVAVLAVVAGVTAGTRSCGGPKTPVAVSASATLTVRDTRSAGALLVPFGSPAVTADRVAIVYVSWHSLGNPCGLIAVVHRDGGWSDPLASVGDLGPPVPAAVWRSMTRVDADGQQFARVQDRPFALAAPDGRIGVLFGLGDTAGPGRAARVFIADRCDHGTPALVPLTRR